MIAIAIACFVIFDEAAGFTSSVIVFITNLLDLSVNNDFFQVNAENAVRLLTMALVIVAMDLCMIYLLRRIQKSEDTADVLRMELIQSSMLDPLTKIKNRMALRRDFPHWVGNYLFVMVIDLDNFTKLNQTHGTQIGDEALIKLADFLKWKFPEESCYRYGGDEFLIIEKSPDVEATIALVEQVRNFLKVSNIAGSVRGQTFSSGYVTGTANNENQLRDMLQAADSKMNEAKKAGKGRTHGTQMQSIEAQGYQRLGSA